MSRLETAWRTRGWLACLLWPVSLLLRTLVATRRTCYKLGVLRQTKASVPVVVVGNLSVGGTGKSPLTQALVTHFQEFDWRPGIVARGYGGTDIESPQMVTVDSDPGKVGDEPVMLASRTGVPICVCANRSKAVATLVGNSDVNIVFSDDGLQHYAMARDAEIVVVDEHRGFSNRWMLPAGPLREPLSRLNSVDVIAVHRTSEPSPLELPMDVSQGRFHLEQIELRLVTDGGEKAEPVSMSLGTFSGQSVHGAAGIGDPARFFRQLELAGMHVHPHPKSDHHVWSIEDLTFDENLPVLITSKDAVKVRALLENQSIDVSIYEVCVNAVMDANLSRAVSELEQKMFSLSRNRV